MIQTDCHMHTHFSPDSTSSLEDLITEAENLGLSVITFTDHVEFQKTDDTLTLDVEGYRKEFLELKESYDGPLKIFWGAEVGLRLDKKVKEIQKLISDPGWDFVIGSIHRIGDIGVFNHELYEKGYSKAALQRRYLEETLEAINFYEDFNTLGHLDFIARYGSEEYLGFEWEKHLDLAEAIFSTLITKGIALEINTASYRYGLGTTHPAETALEFYKSMGGELITVGSDAHTVDSVGAEFEHVRTILLNLGFKTHCYFDKGKPIFLNL